MKFLYILLLAITIVCTSCSNKPSQEEQKQQEDEIYYNTLDRATKKFQQSDYPVSEKLIQQAITISPKLPMAYYMFGMLYTSKGEGVKAGEQFKQALTRSSTVEKERIIKEIYSITNVFKNDRSKELYNESFSLIENKEYAKAITKLLPALHENPNNVLLYYSLGICYNGLNKTNQAIKNFETGLAINPAHEESIVELVTLYTQNEYPQKLIFILEQYIEYYGESDNRCTTLAVTLFKSGEIDRALVLFEKNITKYPQTIVSFYYTGKIYFNQKNNELCREKLELFIQKAKDSNITNLVSLTADAEKMLKQI